jgi:hypothetical protein
VGPPGALRILLVSSALVGSSGILLASAPIDRPDVGTLIAQVGERVAVYYQRAQRLICLERSTVVPIGADWSMQGFARTIESELRVEIDAASGDSLPDPRVARTVRRVNGREPRNRDRTDRSGCTDPTPLSPEPLAFLLPGRRDDYRFTAVRDGRERDRAALLIDFATSSTGRRAGRPELIEDEHGHDDCFDWKGPVAISGRLWVDARTHDVLRLERHIAGPTDLRVPDALQQRYRFPPWLTIDRDDLTMRYKEVAFSDPDEVMLLPESIESITVLRSALQSIRRTQVFSDYRRFLTGSRIVKGGSRPQSR